MRIRTVRDIGLLIREARTRRGLTQAALAKMINVTQSWISWIENGKTSAEIGKVLLALAALGVEMNFNLPSSEADDKLHRKNDPADVAADDVPPYTL